MFVTQDILGGFNLQDALASGIGLAYFATAMDIMISSPPYCIISCTGMPSVPRCSHPIPANSPSLGRSLRHFRLAKISVRGDGNLRHLSIGFFHSFFSFSGHQFVFSSYNADEWANNSFWHPDEMGDHVEEMQEKESVQGPL